ncbi:CYFA0S37e00100g1_1 [Cyberlindnera fabianii]|uniref:CYFA0S37e00100g1_1 n=1 Tax=Cyberlindnera fabianii TaxID=36022 RepID=A0A061BCP9_CYBFA|nr:Positive regulator of purine utilization [Cyberlindnera fabianii]CDR47741.1 CYFA0S37e00100g1_1 [Cyberlindnera fabianii]
MPASSSTPIPGQSSFRVVKPTKKTAIEVPLDGPPIKHRLGGKHQIGACCSCKAKKKKCDGAYPACGGCVSSGIECTIVDLATSRTIPRDYIEQLEKKILALGQEIDTLKTSGQNSSVKRSLEMEIGYITLGAGAESNGFLGDSSAYSIAKAITSTIGYYNKKEQDQEMCTPPDVTDELSNIPFTKPSPAMAHNYMASYFDNVQCQYPFLEWDVIEQHFSSYLAGRSNQEAEFFLYMIFAVGSQVYSNYSSSSNIYTRMYYDKAMESVHRVVERATLESVQAYLMLSVFAQKMPDASSIWQTIGLAIRTAAALGLHRVSYRQRVGSATSTDDDERRLDQLKLRVLWCAYGMERINGIILGRPFGIADVDIDVPLPDDSLSYRVSNHVIKLRRIQSNICTFVYSPFHMTNGDEDSTRVGIVLELNEWMSTFPAKMAASSIFESRNWAEISYHNSMILLLRPVVLEVSKCSHENNTPSSRSLEWFKVFTQSASAICMNYKELHSKGKMGYTWLAMHCIFVAGLSFLYCVWIDNAFKLQVLELKRKSLIYDTISACSSILYVFAERFKKAIMFRNTFERVSNTVLLKLNKHEQKRTATQTSTKAEVSSSTGPLRISTASLGVLDERSIGIDQYFNFEPSLLWGNAALPDQSVLEVDNTASILESSQPVDHSEVTAADPGPVNLKRDDMSPIEPSLWEFLDTTGDKYLRDIFHSMEQSLSAP